MTSLRKFLNILRASMDHDNDCSGRWWIGADGKRHCDCGAYEMAEQFGGVLERYEREEIESRG